MKHTHPGQTTNKIYRLSSPTMKGKTYYPAAYCPTCAAAAAGQKMKPQVREAHTWKPCYICGKASEEFMTEGSFEEAATAYSEQRAEVGSYPADLDPLNDHPGRWKDYQSYTNNFNRRHSNG